MMTRAALIMAMMLARHAHADSTVSIETHGVEIEVPGGWSDTNKGDLTTLRPKLYKGRAIEVLMGYPS